MPRHLYHFSPATIRRLLQETGFDLLELSQANGHDVFKFSIDMLRGRELHQARRGGAREQVGSAPRASAPRIVRPWVNRAAVNGFTGLADRLGLGSQMLIVAGPRAVRRCFAARQAARIVRHLGANPQYLFRPRTLLRRVTGRPRPRAVEPGILQEMLPWGLAIRFRDGDLIGREIARHGPV
jgi:hypothetical protein